MSTPEEKTPETAEVVEPPKAPFTISMTNGIIIALVLVIVVQMFAGGESDESEGMQVAATATAMPVVTEATLASSVAPPAPEPMSMPGGIERKGEGRLFYTTIRIPANAETLYLSGSGAAQKADGSWGNMEEQAIDTFNKFRNTLEGEGWSMADIVQVRAFAVAGEYGLLDFDGFNRGYQQFFGTPENPNKPVRSFVQVADLVVDGWLVEVEIRAARVPAGS